MKYRVIGHVASFGGDMEIGLTQDQAASRKHVLDEVGKGRYRAKGEIQFKRGEVVDIAAKPEDLPRYLADILEPASAKAKTAKSDPAAPDASGASTGTGGEGDGA